MFVSKIKSRPQYEGLRPVAARRHLIAAEGDGAQAVRALFAAAPPGFAERAEIFYAPRDGESSGLGAPGARTFRTFASIYDLLLALDNVLAHAFMGTRLYVAGREGFIGRALQLAIDHGVDHRSVLTEHSGTLARRVQCVHCKGFTDDVTTSIFECGHCGVLLFVRDHYSRRLAAFQGVAVNAEDPGSRPAGEEIYR
jgi:dimethylamine monooxygenase subunit C